MKNHELCRLATSSMDSVPHITRLRYTIDAQNLVIAIGYGSKKLRNLGKNKRVSLMVGEYHPDKGVVLQGRRDVYKRRKGVFSTQGSL